MTEPQEYTPERINELLSAFKNFEGCYRREEVDAAVALREEITPHLLEVLEHVVQSPGEFAEDVHRFDHIYALMLLGFFGEAKAHSYLVSIASLPHDLLFEMFDDMVTEDFGHLLLETCGGDLAMIEGLLRNKEADDYARGAAADALAYAAVDGAASLELVMSILVSVFDEWKEAYEYEDEDEEKEFRSVYQFIASRMLALQPVEVADRVREALDHGMIEPLFLNDRYIDECVRIPDVGIDHLRRQLLRREQGGVHGRIGWWACFKENARLYSPPIDAPVKPAKVNKAKQDKRKAQKKSRQKNRRK